MDDQEKHLVIDYGARYQAAMLGLVRQVLTDVSLEGLEGDHHFYITFDTRHPGVGLSPSLMAQFPEAMTIVLQHQFWDLLVDDEAFSVSLRFSGSKEVLHIPFAALLSFADPAAEFALQFRVVDAESDDGNAEAAGSGEEQEQPATAKEGAEKVVQIDAFRSRESRS